MPALRNLSNQTFGRLNVISRSGSDPKGKATWVCLCECGTEKIVTGQTLLDGSTKSCGCLNAEQKREICVKRNTTHGMRRTKEYAAWTDMNTRCTNPNSVKYPRYGARGISVCERWNKFESFFEDMGSAPSLKHTLDRIDSNGMYCIDNCRWATQSTQQNNRTNNRLITHNGETHTLQEWSKLTNIPRKTISNRIDRGWESAKALSVTLTPPEKLF